MRPVLRRSIATRLTLSLGLVAAVGFGLVGLLLYRALDEELVRANRETLRGKLEAVRHVLADKDEDLRALEHRLDDLRIGHGGLFVWLLRDDRTVLYGGALPQVLAGPDSGGLLRARGGGAIDLDVLQADLTQPTSWDVRRIQVAIDAGPREKLLANYGLSLGVICVLGTTLNIALGMLAAHRGLAPVKRLSQDAARITARSLDRRLSNVHNDAEIQDLARAFNVVLDRIERAYRQLDAFSADVSHELRSAIATLIAANQVVLMGQTSMHELRQALAENVEELEQMNSLVNDMLLLARSDQRENTDQLQWIDLAAEVDKTLRYCEAWIHDAGLTAMRVGTAHASCNPVLIRRVLVNLIANAVDNTSPGSEIIVNLETAGHHVRLQVFNPGPPMDAEQLSHMFERFVRLGKTPTLTGGGHGLGLAIVRAIARMHGGTVIAEAMPYGNRIGIEFPIGSLEEFPDSE